MDNAELGERGRGWATKDQWLASARENFRGALEAWKDLAKAQGDDGVDWARQDALKQVAEELDWNNHDANSTEKKEFEMYRVAVLELRRNAPEAKPAPHQPEESSEDIDIAA